MRRRRREPDGRAVVIGVGWLENDEPVVNISLLLLLSVNPTAVVVVPLTDDVSLLVDTHWLFRGQ